MISDQIVKIAKSYIGQHEKPSNSGFKDAEFEKRMKDVGWSTSLSWCVFFTELVWKEAYGPGQVFNELSKLFSGSATTTYKNFELSKTWKVGQKPVPGAIAIWRYGNGWQGHAAVVVSVGDKKDFNTVEGNTNSEGGREGVEVAEKTRLTGKAFTKNGLNLVGFIYPKDVTV